MQRPISTVKKNYEFYWGYKSHVLVDCISGLTLYELTTPANIADSTIVKLIFKVANQTRSLEECTFLADKGYDVKAIYNLARNVHHGEAIILLNKRNTKDMKLISSGNPVCEVGLTMHKEGKTPDNHGGLRKILLPVSEFKDR